MTLRLLLTLLLFSLLAACAAPRGPGPSPSRPERAAEAPLPPVVQDANPTDGRCGHCGVVERIERTAASAPAKEGDEEVLGGIVGGVLEDEKGGKTRTSGFEISVRLDNGTLVTVRQRALGGVRQGLRVEIVDGRAQPLLQ